MVVIIPINPHIHKAEHVTEKYRPDRFERREPFPFRHSHLQHHYGDDDRNDTIAERFHPVLFHLPRDNKTSSSCLAEPQRSYPPKPASSSTRINPAEKTPLPSSSRWRTPPRLASPA